MAGLLIAESAAQHAVYSEIRPLRDIFSLLFFTSLGLIIPQGFIFNHFGTIFGLTTLVVGIKFIVVMCLILYFGYHAKTSFIVSIALVEVGEFAFILARLGLSQGVISQDAYSYILSVALLSILVMPPLLLAAPSIYSKIRVFFKTKFPVVYLQLFSHFEQAYIQEELPYKDHVVLCGYGRVGKYVGRALTMAKIPYVVVEYNHQTLKELKDSGVEVVYGDPSDIDILDYAQVDKARAVVIAIPDLHTQQMVIVNSLKLNKNIKIYCRSHHEEHQKHLKNLGVTSVIQPEFEAALSITDKILTSFGTKQKDIEGKITRLKIEHGL